jgi:hypothetical protein
MSNNRWQERGVDARAGLQIEENENEAADKDVEFEDSEGNNMICSI